MMRDKSAARIYKSASCPPRREPFGPRHFDEFTKPPRVRSGNRAAKRRDAVIAPALVVIFRRRTLTGFHDQSLFLHSLDGTVQSSRTQFKFPMRASGHILDDGVAVA